MNISEYIESVKTYLLIHPIVEDFKIIRERITAAEGHIRAKLTLTDGNFMEFSEYVRLLSDGNVNVITYSYHCYDASGNLIVRWDNTPHFPDLPCFPHHKHIGLPETVESSQPMDIFKALDSIINKKQAS